MLVIGQRRSFEKGNLRFENGRIPGDPDVVGHHIRQPEQIVGDPGTDPGAARRVPPMLDIPLGELATGGQQDLFPRQMRPGGAEGHDVLQLIAETIGTARLVETGPTPDAAAQGLIAQPAIDQQIGGSFGGAHLDRSQEIVPPGHGPGEGVLQGQLMLETEHQFPGPDRRFGLTQHADDITVFARRQFNGYPECRAGIKARADPFGQPGQFHADRLGQGAVAADKGGAVAAVGFGRRGDGGKRDPIAIVRVVPILCEKGPGFFIPAGDDMHPGGFAVFAQGQFDVIGYRDPAFPPGCVGQPQPLQFDRLAAVVIDGNEDHEFLFDAMAVVLKDGISRSMPGPVGHRFPDRRHGRRPEGAAFLVADVEGLRGRIEYRIVGPAGQAVALAVAIPGEAGPGFTDHGPEVWVGDDIDPWRRGVRVGAEIYRVFPSIRGEAAEAVEIFQLHEGQRG